MTDPTIPLATPPAAPKPPISTGRRILTIAIALVVAAAAYFGVRFALDAIATGSASSQQEQVEEDAVADDEAESTDDGRYTDELAGFSIGSDGEPTVAQIDDDTTHTTGSLDGRVYEIFVIDNPELVSSDLTALRENILSGFIATGGSTVRGAGLDTLSGEEALLAITDLEGSPSLHLAIAIHNDLIFVVVVAEQEDDSDDAVFNSFEFTN